MSVGTDGNVVDEVFFKFIFVYLRITCSTWFGQT